MIVKTSRLRNGLIAATICLFVNGYAAASNPLPQLARELPPDAKVIVIAMSDRHIHPACGDAIDGGEEGRRIAEDFLITKLEKATQGTRVEFTVYPGRSDEVARLSTSDLIGEARQSEATRLILSRSQTNYGWDPNFQRFARVSVDWSLDVVDTATGQTRRYSGRSMDWNLLNRRFANLYCPTHGR